MIIINNLFLDNNVIIGYLYRLDSLNPQSEKVINSNNNFYYSYNVKLEMDKVTSRKCDEYEKFFSLLLSKLRKHSNNQFVSKTDFHLFIKHSKSIGKLSIEDMHYAFDYFWDFFDFGENQLVTEIKLKLRKFIIIFGKTHDSRKNNFFETAIYIPGHRHKDQQIIDMIIAKSLTNDIHSEDEKILFDLQEYSKKHPELDLILVSWDKTFINVLNKIKEVLSFNDFICLDDEIYFNNNK